MRYTAFILIGLCFCGRKSEPDVLALLLSPAQEAFVFTEPGKHNAQIRDRIVRAIDDAGRRIVVYCYDLDEEGILQALRRAEVRGVELSITGSPDQEYPEALAAGLSIRRRPGSGLQHAKVMLVDDELFISGTGNFSESDIFHNHNGFYFMRPGSDAVKRIEESLEREAVDAPVVHGLPFGSRLVVSPARGRLIQSILLQKILGARESVRYLIYSHSDPVITDALYLAASRGVLVEGVYDQAALAPGQEGRRLNDSLGLAPAVIYEEGNRSVFEKNGVLHGGKLHHKTMIIDDRVVLTGSYNYSMNARDSNQEVFLVIEDSFAAAVFRDEFDRIAADASVLGRPPLLAKPSFPPQQPYCFEGDFRLTSFYGAGPSFGADHIRSNGCADFTARTVHSAGLSSGNGYDAPEFFRTNVLNTGAAAQTDGTSLPAGRGLSLRGITRNAVWAGIPGCRRMTGFSRTGIFERVLTETASGFYTFSPISGSDSLFWLECGEVHTACAQNGATLDAALAAYLDFMEFEGSAVPACAPIE